jgi:hypothetical protein
MPSTPFSGVRISWLIEARKFDFATVAASACCLASISASSGLLLFLDVQHQADSAHRNAVFIALHAHEDTHPLLVLPFGR